MDVRSSMGKALVLAHKLSSIFGEMNRDSIISAWAKTQNIEIEKIASHSHDSITLEQHGGGVRVVHRNGVQNLGRDRYCALPSAMGNFSYIMKNAFNEEAYYSTNHGTGRMQDKHIARACYTEAATKKEMQQRRVALFRVGDGSLAEQNMHAFKDPETIISEMERNGLAFRAAKIYPIAVIKG